MSGLVFRNMGSLAQTVSSEFPVKDLENGTPAVPPMAGSGQTLAQVLAGGGGGLSDAEKKLISKLLDTEVPYDKKLAKDLLTSVAAKTGLPVEFIAASSLQEGMNLAIEKPDEASEAYSNANVDPNQFPVDGFRNYGLDTFADAYSRLVKKGYMPSDFKYQQYKAQNEQKMWVNTAAFKNNEDAVYAKAAYLKDFMDTVKEEASKRKIELDDRATRFFTMAAYNGGPGALKEMLDEMKASNIKPSDYIEKGGKAKKQVYINTKKRMDKMDYLKDLFKK